MCVGVCVCVCVCVCVAHLLLIKVFVFMLNPPHPHCARLLCSCAGTQAYYTSICIIVYCSSVSSSSNRINEPTQHHS